MSFVTFFATLDKLVTERFPSNKAHAKAALLRWTLEVIFQESAGNNIAQIGGGPGRGYFQYEIERGSGASKVQMTHILIFICSR